MMVKRKRGACLPAGGRLAIGDLRGKKNLSQAWEGEARHGPGGHWCLAQGKQGIGDT